MSKKHRSKKIAPGAFAAVMATAAAAAPETFSAVTKAMNKADAAQKKEAITSGQAEGWICHAAIQRVQGAGAMREYIQLQDLCTVRCEVPEPGCHMVRVTVERV